MRLGRDDENKWVECMRCKIPQESRALRGVPMAKSMRKDSCKVLKSRSYRATRLRSLIAVCVM